MEIDKFSNIQRRTNVDNSELEGFLEKVSAIENAIKGLKDGTIAPEQIKIEGIETDEDLKAKEILEAQKREEKRIKDESLRLQRKKEEIARWWNGVDSFKSSSDQTEVEGGGSEMALNPVFSRYSSNYSRWEDWAPSDPATIEEERIRQLQEDKKKNEEFEMNNKEFCEQFKTDLKEREKSIKQTESSAEVLRIQGNNCYKRHQYNEALVQYMNALKIRPYDSRTLLNIAQCHIKLKDYEGADEFLKRTIFLKPNNPKALSRQAHLWGLLGRCEAALTSARMALQLDPKNVEIASQVTDLEAQVLDAADEKIITAIRGRAATGEADVSTLITSCSDGLAIYDEMDALLEWMTLSIDRSPSPATVAVANSDGQKDEPKFAGMKGLKDFCDRPQQLIEMLETATARDPNSEEIRLFRTYFRRIGLMSHCGQYILDNLGLETKAATIEFDPSFGDLALSAIANHVQLLCLTARSQHATQVYLLDSDLLQRLTCWAINNTLTKDENGMKLLMQIFRLFDVCTSVTDRGHGKTYCHEISRNRILSNEVLYRCMVRFILSAADVYRAFIQSTTSMRESSHNNTIQPTPVEKNDSPNKVLESICHILYEMVMYFKEKRVDAIDFTQILMSTEPNDSSRRYSLSIPCVLSTILFTKFQNKSSHLQGFLKVDTLYAISETLLACSQVESLRQFFTQPLPSAVVDLKPKDGEVSVDISMVCSAVFDISSPCGSLIFLSNNISAYRAVALAILMNICVAQGEDLSIHRLIWKAGATELVLSLLGQRGPQVDVAAVTRSAGLMARLSVLEETKQMLVEPRVFRILCKAMAQNILDFKESDARFKDVSQDSSWLLEERAHLIRILAAIEKPAETCKSVARDENLIPSILGVLPEPRDDLGEITSESVVLPPRRSASSVVIGNAARCLMQFADDPNFAQIIFCEEFKGIEKFICAMSNCSDIRARRNLAILIAKGCKINGVKDKVVKLRGMEIIRALQDQL